MYFVVLKHEMYVNIMHSRQICVLMMLRVHCMYILSSPVIWGDMSTAVPGPTELWSGVVDGVLTATPPAPDITS